MRVFTRRTYARSGLVASLALLVVVGWGCNTGPDVEKIAPLASADTIPSSAVEDRAQAPTSQLLGVPEQAQEAAGEAAPANSEAAEGATPEPAMEGTPENEPYTLEPGDVLEFRSFDDETLSKEVIVRFDGCVSLSMVPDINVQGITREEAEELLRQAYASVFKDPQLSLMVRDSASRGYYVFGDVQQPNEYPYRRRTTIFQAINKAGGLRIQNQGGSGGSEYGTGLGTLTKAFVIRHEGGEREVMEYDLSGITKSGPHPSEVTLMPDDVVYIPEGVNLVYILGEVQRPSVFQLTENMTLLRLLAQAGGHIETSARLRQVVLIRSGADGMSDVMSIDVRKLLRTGEDIRLEAGDILYIPRKPLLRVQEFVNRFTGSITPLLNLYNTAWETSYTKRRLEALFDDTGSDVTSTLSVLQSVRDLGTLLQPTTY